MLAFVETYGSTRGLISRTLSRFGIAHTLLSIEDRTGIERTLAERPTRLVWSEAPTNPVLKVPDIAHLVACARRNGALTAIDNTFAGLESHGDLGIHFFVHSLTKYAAGHGDVMGGAIMGSANSYSGCAPRLIRLVRCLTRTRHSSCSGVSRHTPCAVPRSATRRHTSLSS